MRPAISYVMDLNGTQHGEEACSRTEESPSDPDHRIDVHGSHDAKTIDRILADLKSLEEQVKAIQEAPRPAKKFTVHGKLLESVIAEEGAEENLESIAAFKRLKNRLWIKENTVYDELLQDAEGSYNLITQRVDRREKRVEELTNQVFNLVGFFSVFQGVILTAVTQLSTSVTTHLGATQARPLCGKVWVPVVLSALAAVASVVAVILKFKHLYTLDDSISDEKHYQSVRGFSHATYIQSFVVAVSS